jgi:autotransporter passenger strand-loop-strand repeat protein
LRFRGDRFDWWDPTIGADGIEYVSSGGIVVSATINSGGNLYILSSGSASATSIAGGGTATVSSGGTASGTIVGTSGDRAVVMRRIAARLQILAKESRQSRRTLPRRKARWRVWAYDPSFCLLTDYLVGAGQKPPRHCDAKRLGGRFVDDQLEPCRGHDRHGG